MAVEPKPKGRPPERLTVEVRFKIALSTPPEIRTVTWPKNWPTPEPGDQVTIEGLTGIVDNRMFNLDAGRLIVNTR